MAPQPSTRIRASGVVSALLACLLVLAHPLAPAGHTQDAKASASGSAAPQEARTATHLPPGHVPYDLPFGPGAFLPSEAQTDFPGFLKPQEVPTAAYCAHCHQGAHDQWRQSAHANSFRTPWYLKNIADLQADRGVAATRHCEGCHNPVALLSGALTSGSTVPRPHDGDGVTCMVCHSIQEVKTTRGLGSYTMGRPAVLVDAQGQAVPGLPSDQQILQHLDWHKRAVSRPLYQSPEFCASCHKAAVPKALNGYKWLRTFSAYDEWQQSSWSTETPLTFYKKVAAASCQSCHMPLEPSTDPAARGHLAPSHRWLGANTAIPVQYGYAEQGRRVIEFLQADQLQVDLFALTVEHTPTPGAITFAPETLIAPLGDKPFRVLPGDWVRVDVVVKNKGIGHSLIPELRDFYESWLEFQATDDAGHVLFHSGGVGPDHLVDGTARKYSLRIVDQAGKGLDHHQVWKTYVKAYDATVSPGRSDVARFRFRLPETATGVHLTASVRYRRFNRAFTDWVFDDQVTAPDRFPTITLASASRHLAVGMNPGADPAEKTYPPDNMKTALRWNDYGIGMLDRQQFAEAAHAFRQVVRLVPHYEPGLVNVAIAEYSRGRYPDALAFLDRAHALETQDARADYYRGLCLRWQTHFDQAIAVLEPVAVRYPRFRQVHQELGYLYMVRRRFAESRDQYLAVLEVDPDDPTAHRWLGPVYAALGDPARAAQEARITAQTGNDTAAGYVAQQYWRDHLDLAAEAMPAHTHSPGNTLDDADVRRVLQLQNPPSYIWEDHY